MTQLVADSQDATTLANLYGLHHTRPMQVTDTHPILVVDPCCCKSMAIRGLLLRQESWDVAIESEKQLTRQLSPAV